MSDILLELSFSVILYLGSCIQEHLFSQSFHFFLLHRNLTLFETTLNQPFHILDIWEFLKEKQIISKILAILIICISIKY